MQVIQEASSEDSLSWLVSLWVYRDPLVASCGRNVAAALAGHTSLLHCSLTQVSGGVWAAALRWVQVVAFDQLIKLSTIVLCRIEFRRVILRKLPSYVTILNNSIDS